jgi:acetyltransferase
VIFGDPILDASRVVTAGSNELIIFLGGADVERAEKIKMHKNGVPVFPTPERGIRALAQLIPPELKGKRAQHTFPVATGRSHLGLYESLQFLENHGFSCIMSRKAESPGKAVHLAHMMGFPVAMKIDSPDILHKSDFGGVRLGLQSAQDVRTAYEEMMEQVQKRNPEARINGVVVSAMASPGLELILGMNRDPQFGPVIMFGLGGVTVELFRDVSLRLLPLTREDAREMVREIKGAPLLRGYRGRRPINEEALVEGLLMLAEIAEDHKEIVEIDLNPVIAYAEDMIVVDARILKA